MSMVVYTSRNRTDASPRRNAGRLGGRGWSAAVPGSAGRCEGDGWVGWPAGLASLSMLCPFEPEIAHLPLDHAWIAAVSAFWVDLAGDFGQQHPIVIIIVGEGKKTPVSTRGTG